MPGSINITHHTRIAVLCGGLSSEREVSLRSGNNCFEALKRLGYQNVVLIDMDRQVAQRLTEEKAEVVFLALHGQYGEDGCVQGMLEILGIPYTGNRLTASAMTMNKDLTKKILAAEGLPVLPSVTVYRNGKASDSLDNVSRLNFPVMVKPLSEGSSVGMSKVNQPEDLETAVATAAECGPWIMIEQFVKGRDLTVGVFNRNGKPVVTPILEIRPKPGKAEWYDYNAKYTEGMTEFILPAELPDDVTRLVQEKTLEAHQAMGCYGVSRVDWVMDANHQAYILEVNTIPGMTNLSDLPAQAKAMGVSYDELVECLLHTAALGMTATRG
nr:D-alanine--D-alanine ligase [uncultured bacterium]